MKYVWTLLVIACCCLPAFGGGYEAAEIVCPKKSGAITLDGKPDDPAWAKAAETGPLLRIRDLVEPQRYATRARLRHNGEALLHRRLMQ